MVARPSPDEATTTGAAAVPASSAVSSSGPAKVAPPCSSRWSPGAKRWRLARASVRQAWAGVVPGALSSPAEAT